MSIGEKIKVMRKSEMLTQKQLSDLVGIPAGTLIHYEQGKSKPGADALIKLLNPQRFRKYRDWFMFNETNPAAGQIAPVLSLNGQETIESSQSGKKTG